MHKIVKQIPSGNVNGMLNTTQILIHVILESKTKKLKLQTVVTRKKIKRER